MENRQIVQAIALASAALALAGCGSAPSEPITATALDGLTQEARFTRCDADLTRFRNLGVWIAGGEAPIVDKPAWNELSEAEQSQIITTAACLGLEGGAGERIVTIKADKFSEVLATRRVIIKP
jgi:hypothetical protein